MNPMWTPPFAGYFFSPKTHPPKQKKKKQEHISCLAYQCVTCACFLLRLFFSFATFKTSLICGVTCVVKHTDRMSRTFARISICPWTWFTAISVNVLQRKSPRTTRLMLAVLYNNLAELERRYSRLKNYYNKRESPKKTLRFVGKIIDHEVTTGDSKF